MGTLNVVLRMKHRIDWASSSATLRPGLPDTMLAEIVERNDLCTITTRMTLPTHSGNVRKVQDECLYRVACESPGQTTTEVGTPVRLKFSVTKSDSIGFSGREHFVFDVSGPWMISSRRTGVLSSQVL